MFSFAGPAMAPCTCRPWQGANMTDGQSDQYWTADAGLQPHTEHAFRVRACSSAGCSDWSAPVVLSTDTHVPSCPRAAAAAGTAHAPPGVPRTACMVSSYPQHLGVVSQACSGRSRALPGELQAAIRAQAPAVQAWMCDGSPHSMTTGCLCSCTMFSTSTSCSTARRRRRGIPAPRRQRHAARCGAPLGGRAAVLWAPTCTCSPQGCHRAGQAPACLRR